MARKANNPGNLKPFKKGQSGNPNGYIKGQKNRSTILKKWIKVAAKCEDPETKKKLPGTIEDKVVLSLIIKALLGDIQAIKEILDTLYGKIPDKQIKEHKGKIKIDFTND